MKFVRTVLIERVQAEIARREKYAAERTAEAAAKLQARLDDYLAKTTPAWKQLADTIRIRQRYGRPVTAEDIPAVLQGYGPGRVSGWSDHKPEAYTADTGALTVLLTLLQAATDDEITTASLDRMGFRTAELFRTR